MKRAEPRPAASPHRGRPGPTDRPVRWRATATYCVLAYALVGCGGSQSNKKEEPKPEPTSPAIAEVETKSIPDRTSVVVHHAAELARLDLGQARRLDLSLSISDQVGHLHDHDAETTCTGLDLTKLAARAPHLESLRISGCPEAIAAGLASFAPRLTELELADLTLDKGVVDAVAACDKLESLTVTRVDAGDTPLARLGKLRLRSIVLADLDTDSPLGETLELWPKTLKRAHLQGRWAGHQAMVRLAKAEALQALTLEGTRVGNYSLNQIKPLSNLRDLTLSGSTFNDNSPLYFRDLPVKRFVCECPRFGDVGLRTLRHTKGIRVLELPVSRVTGEGLGSLTELDALTDLVLLGHELDEVSLEALGTLQGLRRLELSGPLSDHGLAALGSLTSLQHLRLDCPELDDRAAAALAKLTALRSLDVGGTKVSDASLHALAKMPHLRELHLDRTRVTNAGLQHIAGLTELEVLSLDHTDLVDGAVQHLAGLHNLRVLRLDSTLVTDAALDHLLGLAKLQRLNLANTVVTKRGVTKLTALPSLEVLGLDGIRG